MDIKKIDVTEEYFRNIAMGRPKINKEIGSYLLIQDKFNNNRIDDEFIKTYKWFYKLDNAGLGNEIKKKNFELIGQRSSNIEQILSEIYDMPTLRGYHTIQLSFATKIIHTVDNDKPIFDANVSRLLGLNKVISSSNDKEARIKSAKSIYDELKTKTKDILDSPVGKKLVTYFYNLEIPNIKKIPETKAIDFCFWILGA